MFMFRKKMFQMWRMVLLVGAILGALSWQTDAVECRVLIVMSYDKPFWWSQDMKTGIDRVLADTCELTYAYLDTRNEPERGHAKAEQAYALYRQLQPDGVIATDDNAQAMFVVPYLKDKVTTPIIFCGVNEPLATYGYPTATITGVRELLHYRETILFVQQLVPEVNTFGFLMRKSSTAQGFLKQLREEAETYSAELVDAMLVETFEEAKNIVTEFTATCDALFLEFMDGIPDAHGNPLSNEECITKLARLFGKPVFCANRNTVENGGALCAVLKLPDEQGELAAEMMRQVLVEGTPIAALPVTCNKRGKRVLNVSVMKRLGIKPKPHVLKGVEFVESGK